MPEVPDSDTSKLHAMAVREVRDPHRCGSRTSRFKLREIHPGVVWDSHRCGSREVRGFKLEVEVGPNRPTQTSTSNLKPRAQDRAKSVQSSSGLDHGILYSIDNADLHPKPDASARTSAPSRPGSLPSSAWVNLRKNKSAAKCFLAKKIFSADLF